MHDRHLRPNADECRPAQLFGAWACEPSYLANFVDVARNADLAALRAERRAELAAARASGVDQARPLFRQTEDGIAIVELTGPLTKYDTSFQSILGGTSTLRAREALRAASRDPAIPGILVVADSPGGTHAGTADLAAAIRAASERKPLYTFAEDLAASAALWAISAGGRVLANPGAIVGSIGVYSVVLDQSQQYAQAGVEVHVISSAPPIKGMGVVGSKILPAQLAEWQRMVDELATQFVDGVASLRGMKSDAVRALATGQVWSAAEAQTKGLLDGVCSLEEALDSLRKEPAKMSKPLTIAPIPPSALARPAAVAAAAADPAPAPASAPSADQAAANAPSADAPPAAAPAAAIAPAEAATAATAPAVEPAAAAPPAAESEVERLRAELAQANARADALDRERRSARFRDLAQGLNLPAALVPVLDRVEAAVAPADFAALQSAFSAAAAQTRNAHAFAEIGAVVPAAAVPESEAAAVLARAEQLLKEGKAGNRSEAIRAALTGRAASASIS